MQRVWPAQVYESNQEGEMRAARPTVVFLHGFLGQGSDWLPFMDAFIQDYRCLLPDLPGHGANLDGQDRQTLSFARLAQGLERLLDRLGIGERVHLVGYSMGGRVALYFAVHRPERVQSLVLESASPGLSKRQERQERRQLDDLRAAKLLAGGLDAFLEEWYAQPLFTSLSRQPDRDVGSDRLETLKARRRQNDAHWIARAIAELSPGRQPALWNRLGELRMPVLLLAGEQDEKYAALVRKMGSRIPNATVIIAPGAGHNIHLESPRWYEACLQDFWKGH